MKNNILLCDLGGTHARFAKFETKGEYSHFKKYRLNDFSAFEDIIQKYHDDSGLNFDTARFACARTPIDGKIQYRRHAGDPDFEIDFTAIQSHFHWDDVTILNDLSAGAYGLPLLKDEDAKTVISAKNPQWNTSKCLISVGTGIGHSGIYGTGILDSPGGHWLPITVTDEQQMVEKFIRQKKDNHYALIMEDFISSHGLQSLAEYISGDKSHDMTPDEFMMSLKNYPDAVRLFFEFLGIYANTLTAITGFYGGVYLTGGVIDHLVENNLTAWKAFEDYYKPSMVQSVDYRLNGAPISYVLHNELPLLGLTAI